MNVECSWWKYNIDQDREKSEANSIYLSGNTKDIYSMLVKSAFSKNNTRDEGDINLPVEPLAKEKYILPETFWVYNFSILHCEDVKPCTQTGG